MSLSELSDASLVERWQRRGDDAAREALVHRYRGLVRALAARYVNWGEPFDDLVQVAWIGLLKAIERYDSERGVQFPTYATPTIVGEIRRYYRDRAWAVHVPRSVQELRVRVNATIDQWSAEHGEAPTTAELASTSTSRRTPCSTRSTARTRARRSPCRAARTTARPRGFDVPTEERGFDQVDAQHAARAAVSTTSPSASARSSRCASRKASPSRRSPRASASRRCTSRACCAARSRSCARRSARSTRHRRDSADLNGARGWLAADAQGQALAVGVLHDLDLLGDAREEVAAARQAAGSPHARGAARREGAEAEIEPAVAGRRDRRRDGRSRRPGRRRR